MENRRWLGMLIAIAVIGSGVACGRHRDADHPDHHAEKHRKEKKKKKKGKDTTDDEAQTGVVIRDETPPAPVEGDAGAPAKDTRRFSFNGRPATDKDLATLSVIERLYGRPTPPGEYWYDAKSGAAGGWGGPTLGFLPAGLELGGPLPANASGGGDGKLSGIFINGREIHPIDVKVLMGIYGQVIPGRWWVDGAGNAGKEGGPPLINLVQLAQQRSAAGKGSGAESYYRSDGKGNNAFVGGGCVSTSHTTGSGSDKKTYDYYGPGC